MAEETRRLLKSFWIGSLARTLYLALLGGWLGAMTFFSFLVAPTAFAVLPERHLAGNLVAGLLNRLHLIGYVVGPILIALALSTRSGRPATKGWLFRVVLPGMMTASSIVSRELIGPRLLALRHTMGTIIDQVPPTDPLRIAFNQLHRFSVGLMLFSILAGVIALAISVWEWHQGP